MMVVIFECHAIEPVIIEIINFHESTVGRILKIFKAMEVLRQKPWVDIRKKTQKLVLCFAFCALACQTKLAQNHDRK